MLGITSSTGDDSFRPLLLHRQQQEQQSTRVDGNGSQANRKDDLNELPAEEEKEVRELKKRNREVRQHEQAHIAAAGPYAIGGPHYQFRRGPDGKSYAVGGEVKLDTSPVRGGPEATIRKAQVIRRAALAPPEPSAQDRRIAAQASGMEREARTELREKQQEEAQGDGAQNQPLSQVNIQNPNIPQFSIPGTLIDLLV